MEAAEVEEEIIASDNLYSTAQLKVLFVLPIISGTLSVIGSSLILYVILSDSTRKLKRVYHRALAAYSVIDVIVSSQYMLSSIVVPKGTVGVWGAVGNWTTCQISGFLIQFSMSLGLYLAFICAYYVLTVRYRVREETIATKLEPYVHFAAFVLPLILGILMLLLDMYNPTNINPGNCFINPYPANCLRVEGVECKRGENYAIWSLITFIPFWIYFVVVVITTVLTFLTVHKDNYSQQRWSFVSQITLSEEVGGGRWPENYFQASYVVRIYFRVLWHV